jgi:hypothetical protein
MDGGYLFVSMLLGVVGMAYFVYGKRQMKVSALASGTVLCVFPLFITNLYALLGVGAAMLALPFLIDF